VDLKFVHGGLSMFLNGFDADPQLERDGFVGLALGRVQNEISTTCEYVRRTNSKRPKNTA
jgi:hypothetical protein